MKQIFDWLREQINKKSFMYASKDGARRKYIDCADLETIINEAEAKWESKVCEWRIDVESNFFIAYKTTCGNYVITGTCNEKYCRHCGKPIKISEVE